MAGLDGRSATGIYLNGATIMTTRTARHIEVARAAGFDGVEVRAERLLDAPDEVREAAAIVKPGEVWSLNGIQLQLGPDGRLDRERLEAELPPRLEICRSLGASYLLVVPPRAPGAERAPSVAAMRDGLARIRDAAAIDRGGHGVRVPRVSGTARSTRRSSRRRSCRPCRASSSCWTRATGTPAAPARSTDSRSIAWRWSTSTMHRPKPPREIEDADRVLPGGGVIRLADLVADLTGRGYRGPWSLETFNPDVLGGRPDGDRDDRPASPRRPA